MTRLPTYELNVTRWWIFSAVGIAGLGVHLACLWVLKDGFGLHYMVAAPMAVELAILHNFFCHVRWTWGDRPAPAAILVRRFAWFNLTSGLISLVSLAVMAWLVEIVGMHYLLANLTGVAACSLVNFAVNDVAIFRRVGHAVDAGQLGRNPGAMRAAFRTGTSC